MRIVHILLMLLMMTAAPARAQVLVELFTSQGCSSCPPADKLLGELAERDDVIALAFHVDYWDYLGWKDTFARPEFSDRQRSYAATVDRQHIGRRLRGSFTPEVVIGGYDSLIGSSRQSIVSRISAHKKLAPRARISLERQGNDVVVQLTPLAEGLGQMRVMVASVEGQARVAVERGENRGRDLTYHRVVKQLDRAGTWNGSQAASLKVPDRPGTIVVFLQQGKAGPVLAAAEIN